MTRKALVSALACVSIAVTGCAGIGPNRLKADQVDYARALGDAKKREILAAIVGLRFADSPAFLSVSQIIAAYTFDATAGATLNAGSGADPDYALANGSVSYSNHPTFTFTPTTGQAFATAYIRPLAPYARIAARGERDPYRFAVAHHRTVHWRPAECECTGWS